MGFHITTVASCNSALLGCNFIFKVNCTVLYCTVHRAQAADSADATLCSEEPLGLLHIITSEDRGNEKGLMNSYFLNPKHSSSAPCATKQNRLLVCLLFCFFQIPFPLYSSRFQLLPRVAAVMFTSMKTCSLLSLNDRYSKNPLHPLMAFLNTPMIFYWRRRGKKTYFDNWRST